MPSADGHSVGAPCAFDTRHTFTKAGPANGSSTAGELIP